VWLPRLKRFDWGFDMTEMYVLYTRIGNSEITCMMKHGQFAREKSVGEEIVPEVRNTVEVPKERKRTFQLLDTGLVIDRVLGEGAFSVVVLVHSQAEQYALKLLKPGWATPLKKERLRRELEIGELLQRYPPRGHPLCVKTYRSFRLPNNVVWETCSGEGIPKSTYEKGILLEYVKGGTIKTAIENDMGTEVTLDQLKKYRVWAADITEGMKYMHGLGVAHRDLKPDNVMLKPVHNKQRSFACLGDFGYAKIGDWRSNAGESMFAAPEIPKLNLRQPWTAYTEHCDVFSFGKTLLAMVACTFDADIILHAKFPEGPNFPDTAKRLVEKTTIEDPPAERGRFIDICNHAFFGEDAFAHGTVSAIDFPGLVRDADA